MRLLFPGIDEKGFPPEKFPEIDLSEALRQVLFLRITLCPQVARDIIIGDRQSETPTQPLHTNH